MTCEWRDSRPKWWTLYATGLMLVALLALVEIFVPAGGLRGVLQVAVVMTGFGLMAGWVRHNRVAMELEESRQRRGTVGNDGERPEPLFEKMGRLQWESRGTALARRPAKSVRR
jgi:hypothetical protein